MLWKHTAKENIPFSCSVCDFVSVKESDVKKHHKWYKPHKESNAPVFDVIRGTGTCTTADNQKKWDTTASTLYWIQKRPQNEKENVCTTETKPVDPEL